MFAYLASKLHEYFHAIGLLPDSDPPDVVGAEHLPNLVAVSHRNGGSGLAYATHTSQPAQTQAAFFI